MGRRGVLHLLLPSRRKKVERGPLTLAAAEGQLPEVGHLTVQRDLKRLVELGVVVEEGRAPTDPNRAYRWVGPEL